MEHSSEIVMAVELDKSGWMTSPALELSRVSTSVHEALGVLIIVRILKMCLLDVVSLNEGSVRILIHNNTYHGHNLCTVLFLI